MANVKITQLPLATTPLTGTEVFPLVQGTTTKQVAITGLFTSPVMTNPTLGTVGQADLINATGLPISTGVAGLGTGVATFLGTPSSANLRAAVTDETGSGALVFANAPVLVAPDLGTPSVLVATNATGTAVGLTAGSAITNANLTGAVTSVGNATSLGSFTSAQLRTALTDETGAGSAVFATSPTITAPILNQINDTNNAQILGLSPTTSAVDYLVVKNGIGTGVPLHFYADGSSANIGLHIQPKGTGLVTISDGTDFNKGIRFRSSSSAASAITLLDAVSTAGRVVTLPDATTTLVGRDTTDTLTNKTIAFSSNTFSGTLAIANGGTGQATANAALNALLPAQTGNASKYLQTNGTDSSWDAISLSTADITGVLPTANGGTNLSSFTSGGVVYASSTSALTTGSALSFDGTNLGIGTTSPSDRLQVNKTAAGGITVVSSAQSSLKLANNANTNGFLLGRSLASDDAQNFFIYDLVASASRMYIDASGNVGIGATSGTSKLTVGGSSGTTATPTAIQMDGTYATTAGFDKLKFYLLKSATESYGFGLGSAGDLQYWAGSSSAGVHRWFTSQTERMRIDLSGNVGIGTSSPAKQLHIESATGGTIRLSSSDTSVGVGESLGEIDWYSNDASTSAAGVRAFINVVENDGLGRAYDMTFGTGSSATATEKMRINRDGNVGIGTSSPAAKLDVSTTTGFTFAATPTAGAIIGARGTTGGSFLVRTNSLNASFDSGLAIDGVYGAGSSLISNVNIKAFGVYSGGGFGSTLGFWTSNDTTLAERLRIDQAGNVGIGTTAPTQKLEINIGSGATSSVRILSSNFQDTVLNLQQGAGSTVGNVNRFVFSDQNGTTGAVYGYGSGFGAGFNLGVAIGSNVVSTSTLGGTVNYGQTGAASNYFQQAGAHKWFSAASGTGGTAIAFTQAMTLDANSNLSIGTTSTPTQITFQGGSGITYWRPTNDASPALLDFIKSRGTAASPAAVQNNDGLFLQRTAPYQGSGYAYLNTMSVEVDGTFTSGQNPPTRIGLWTNAANGSSTERARIDSSGNLLVGTTTSGVGNTGGTGIGYNAGASYQSIGHINGTASGSVYVSFGYNGSAIANITQSGTTAVLYNVTSDQRLKENIQDADSASSLIDSLQVRKFDWKTDQTHQRYGFVAQELVTVAPEAVYQPTDTDEMMAVDYSKLVPMLVKEIQSLRKRLADAGI